MATKSLSCRPSAAAEAVLVTPEALSLDAALLRFESPEDGAVSAFLGVVRDREDGRPIRAIHYQAYEAMAAKELAKIAAEARASWKVSVVIFHRTGRVAVAEPSLIVAVRGKHRREAFEAVEFVVEQVKQRATIWKVDYEWADGGAW